MNTTQEKPLVIIMGPTGVGKSDFALNLAHKLEGEIINCDVGQFYAPLLIGTAKPEAWERSPIPHHLFDIVSEPKSFSVTEFRARVEQLMCEIRARNHTPIIVGGSGFYVNALFFPPRDEIAPLCKVSTRKISSATWQALHEIDPVRAEQIHPHDTYRIERALQIWQKTGVMPSTQQPVFKPVSDNFFLVHIERERDELYARINARTLEMVAHGWIEEVENIKDWHDFLLTKRIIGYPEIIEYIRNDKPDVAALIVTIQQATRHYAKRQMTFWRMLAKKLQNEGLSNRLLQANLTLSPVELYIRQLQKMM